MSYEGQSMNYFRKMNDQSLMPFGMHKGKALEDVPASYLIWLHDNNKCFGELKNYIIENMDVLQHQVKEEQSK